MESKKYTFKCGLTAYQEELDTEQFHLVLELLTSLELNINNPQELADLSIFKLLSALKKNKNLIGNFLAIILRDENGTPLYSINYTNSTYSTNSINLKLSELNEVLSDFFTFNPTVKNWFKNLGKILGTLMSNLTISNSPQKPGSDTPST